MVPNLRFTGLCDRGALRRVRLCLTTPLRAHFDRYCVMNRRRLCTVSDLCEVTWTALTCLAIVYRMLRSRIPKAVHGTLCCPVLVWWSLTSTFQKREAWKRCSANCCTNVTQVAISPLWRFDKSLNQILRTKCWQLNSWLVSRSSLSFGLFGTFGSIRNVG